MIEDPSPDMSEDETRPQRRPSELLPHVGAFVALAIASLYVVGAITKIGQVSGAGFSTSVVVGPTPVQQLLSAGISTLATPTGLLVLACAAASLMITPAIVTGAADHGSDGAPKGQPGPQHAQGWFGRQWRNASPWGRWLITPVLAVVALSVLWGLFLTISFSTLAVLAMFPLIYLVRRLTGYTPRASATIACLIALAGTGLIDGFGYPTPLPEVRVTTNAGIVVGQLLGQTDGSITVGLGNCSIESIPSTQIQHAAIFPRTPPIIPDVSGVLFGYGREPRAPFRIAGRCGVNN